MTVTDQQRRAIAFLAKSCRPTGARRWDEPGILAALTKVADRDLATVILATIRAATDRDIDTPGVIPTNGSHWNETAAVKTFTPEKQLDPNDRCSVCYESRADCRRKWTDDDHVFVSCAVAAASRRATAAEARARAVAVVKSAIEYPAERSAQPTIESAAGESVAEEEMAMSENLTTDPEAVKATIGYALSDNPSGLLPNGIEDIAEVIWGVDENTRDTGGDGDELVAVARLVDGSFIAVEGWADYTGWGCRSGNEVTAHPTAEDAFWSGITKDGRRRLHQAGITNLPGSDPSPTATTERAGK